MAAFLIIWLVAQAVSAILVWVFAVGLGQSAALRSFPRVAIIVAVKGHDIEFDGFLARLFAQDYPAFRVIFAVESDGDHAIPAIETLRTRYPDRVLLVVAGHGEREGQKTTNLRAAAAQLTPSDEIVVLADADIWPERDWLRRLVAPLVSGEADLVSGFAWLLPQDRKLSTLVLTAMSASVATMPRLSSFNAAWGGSTALTQDSFRALGLPDAWRGTLSDDLQLTNLAQRRGFRIAAPREILLRTAVETSGFDAIAAEARRWYMLVRVHMPGAYAVTLLAMSFTALGWIAAACELITARPFAVEVLVGALLIGACRALGRATLVRRLWGDRGLRENRRYLLADLFVTPLAACLNAGFGWSAVFMRRTTWSGITYDVNGPTDVVIVSRAEAAADAELVTAR
jgi:hypothetical protein